MENFGESQLTRFFVQLSMASCTTPCFEFSIQVMVCSYQDEWDAVIGNQHDPYAVATLSDGRVVGHVPQKISPVCSILTLAL